MIVTVKVGPQVICTDCRGECSLHNMFSRFYSTTQMLEGVRVHWVGEGLPIEHINWVEARQEQEMSGLAESEMAFALDTHEVWCRMGGRLTMVAHG